MMKFTFNLFRGLLFGLLVALLHVGFATASTLQPNADGTVFDPKTGLTWMRCSMGQVWNGSTCLGTAPYYAFDQANALTGTTTFADQSDWRIPTEDELSSLVDYSTYGPTINSSIFPATPSSFFWSGSPYVPVSSLAWGVGFDYGFVGYLNRSGGFAVRLVRGGGLTIASSSFYSNAVQLTLSNGASVQILGASGFSYQLGANAPAGVAASSLSYAQFAAALGASVPAGAFAVSGSANFVVN